MQNHPFKAGAGRYEIEFPESFFPIEGFEGLHDKPQIRVLLLDAGKKLAIVSVEITSLPAEIVTEFKDLTSNVSGFPPENILVCATHTFSAPHFKPKHMCKTVEDQQHNKTLYDLYKPAIIRATISASSKLKEARFGCEIGQCNINVNRDVRTKDGWWLGSSETGPTDNSVTVLRFDDLKGNPIAILFNYAVQPSVLDGSITSRGGRLLSSDLAGVASRFVEQEYGGDVTALFCIGAAADQAPAVKSKYTSIDTKGQSKTYDFHEQGAILAESLGRRLGAEVLRVTETIQCRPLTSAIKHKRYIVKCPGQIMPKDIHSIKPTRIYYFEPDVDREEPFEIITLGEVALVCVRPELTYQTAAEIRKQSPYPKTMILTMVNGGAKYMADQNAYDRITYEAMNSPFGRGSAELLSEKILQTLHQ